jgi:class 3 adenylate cyclase
MPGSPIVPARLNLDDAMGMPWYERLSRGMRVIGFDHRGVGLSDREPVDFSLEAQAKNALAVVDHLALDKFALFGGWDSGAGMIAFAASHPERVSHLILYCAYARGVELKTPAEMRGLGALLTRNWELFTETFAHAAMNWEGDFARGWARSLRENVSHEAYLDAATRTRQFDVTSLLPEVKCPTLVVQKRDLSYLDVTSARRLASGIPNARLLLLEGRSPISLDVTEPLGDAIDDLLGIESVATPSAPVAHPSAMTAILFADIADSTGLTERFGDAAFRAKARDLDGALRSAIRERGGTPVEGKLLGDGVLAVFTSAREAIEAALACGKAGDEAGLPLHLGMHAGDVIREENNVYGGAVNIASRIAGLSAAGEVLVSETVRSLARTSAGVGFEDRGEQTLKGVGEAVRVWAVAEAANQQTGKPANQGGE